MALSQAGASLDDVVRTRILLTRIADWKQVAAVRGEYFRNIRPVDTVMEVNGFINPDWLIEVEVEAIIDRN
jgi:enamine deaminase RidA (YjgF/YER057c/UK114 family)